MRRSAIVISAFIVLSCLLAQAAVAAAPRPIVYSKVTWEWAGPEGERHVVTQGGLFATADGIQRRLTNDPDDQEPSTSRNDSTIVFASQGDLYAIASEGSARRQLTSGPEIDEHPQISPDGSYVLFARRPNQESPADLYIVSLHGSAPRALAPSPGEDGEASFSPDGRTIVFVRSLPVPGGAKDQDELFSVRPDGTGLTRLTRTREDELHPYYYAKGIVFDRRKTARGGPAAIYTMRRNGGRNKTLLSWRVGANIQAVSPNGHLLVFDAPGRGTWTKHLIGSRWRSLRPHRLYRSSSEYLVFSPDGRRVAGAFENTSSEVAPFSALLSIDLLTGRSRYEGETWEAEVPGPVQTSVAPRIAW